MEPACELSQTKFAAQLGRHLGAPERAFPYARSHSFGICHAKTLLGQRVGADVWPCLLLERGIHQLDHVVACAVSIPAYSACNWEVGHISSVWARLVSQTAREPDATFFENLAVPSYLQFGQQVADFWPFCLVL